MMLQKWIEPLGMRKERIGGIWLIMDGKNSLNCISPELSLGSNEV